MNLPRLKLRAIRARGVNVPMKLPLGTSAGTLKSAALLLVDVETEEGIDGHSYLFCYLPAAASAIAAMLAEIERTAKGDAVAPAELWAKLARRFKLIGVQGIVRMAMSGFDCACWDALAVAAGVPLVALLGGSPRRVRAYNSNGLGLMEPEAAADEAQKLLEGGFRAV
jgi:mandelate racemase